MEIRIQIEDLQKKKLMIGTPLYGGVCHGHYMKSCINLAIAATQYQLDVRFYNTLQNESLVQRARNMVVDEFLRSDCTHLLFIDADIAFNYKDVFTLLHLCESKYNMGIIGGAYAKKTIAWEKVYQAVKAGKADENPFELEKFGADLVFNVLNTDSFDISVPLKVKEIGTGFMMIHRSVFEAHDLAYPEKTYTPDHARNEHFDGSRDMMAYFDCVIDPDSKRYLSEDYYFCTMSRKIGIDVWLCPWMVLPHTGTYTFIGNMAALASINTTPGSNEKSQRKNYKKDKA